MKEEIGQKLGNLKGTVKNKLKKITGSSPVSRQMKKDTNSENVPLAGDAINLDTLDEEDRSQVEFYDTENSQAARGAEKSVAHGIDSFEEKDGIDPDEADEHQTYHDRNHSSDLSDRYYTRGLDVDSNTRSKTE
jgi:hypothetical protein